MGVRVYKNRIKWCWWWQFLQLENKQFNGVTVLVESIRLPRLRLDFFLFGIRVKCVCVSGILEVALQLRTCVLVCQECKNQSTLKNAFYTIVCIVRSMGKIIAILVAVQKYLCGSVE